MPVRDAYETLRSHPVIVVGITNDQTCLVLPERLRALKSAGFRVVLVSSPGQFLHRLAIQEGVESQAIPIRRGISPLADLISFLQLCWLLYRLRPDLTEFSTPKAGLLGSLAARLCGVPVRIYMLRGLRLETLTGIKKFVLLAAERIAAACSDRVVCNSKSLRDKALALRIAPEGKLELIGRGSSNGVDVDHYSPGPAPIRKSLGIPNDVPVVGFVGRLTCDKGVPELVDAFEQILASVPSARLLLVGWFDASDDALSPALRTRIDHHPRI